MKFILLYLNCVKRVLSHKCRAIPLFILDRRYSRVTMVIDKFGRDSHPHVSGGVVQRGPSGVGFKLSSDGNFDIDGKRITNVSDPLEDNDAVNKKSTLIVSENTISARKRRLVEVADPIDDSDVPTKQFVQSMLDRTALAVLAKCMTVNNSVPTRLHFDSKNKRIISLATPVAETDAVHKKYVDDRLFITETKLDAKMESLLNTSPSSDINVLKDSVIALMRVIQVLIKRSNHLYNHFNIPPTVSKADDTLDELIRLYGILNPPKAPLSHTP